MKKAISNLFSPAPTVEQAQAAALAADDALVGCQRSVDRSQAALEAAHDAGNPEAVTQTEATLVAAKAERDRAEQRHKAALRRLETAKADRAAEQRSECIKRLRQACKQRLEAAEQIDRAYADLAVAVERLLAADSVVAELRKIASSSAALGSNYGRLRVLSLLAFAAAKHGLPSAALPGRTPEDIPGTVAAVDYDNGTILLGVER